MPSFPTKLVALAAVATMALGLAGCSPDEEPNRASTSSGAASEWPRTITHELGETTIPEQPKRIVSTSLSTTGALLAIDAPLIATAVTSAGDGADENGFFSQWADVAVARGVDVLYRDSTLDIEAVMAAEPDLIIAVTSGADAAADSFAELEAIAPTAVFNYGDKTWQELALELGEATGLEANAEQVIEDFDSEVQRVAAAIDVPAGTSNIIVYNGAGAETAFAKATGPHATLLTSLGFDVAYAPDDMDASEQARQDFAFLSIENTVAALTAETVFLASGEESVREDLLTTPVLQNAPAISSGAVQLLGANSFRIDSYSAREILNTIETIYGR